MIEKNETDNNQTIGVRVNNRLDQEFLHTLAKEEGLTAWVKPNSRTRIYLEATYEQVDNLLKRAEPAFHRISYRRCEIIAEAMLYAGSQEVAWPQIISQTQAKVSLFVKKNKNLGSAFKSVEKAKDEVPPMMQFAAEAFQSLDDAYDEFKGPKP